MAGRPRKKPEYNPELQFNNFLQELRDAYEEADSLRSLADELNISLLKLRKLLITADVFTSDIGNVYYALHKLANRFSHIYLSSVIEGEVSTLSIKGRSRILFPERMKVGKNCCINDSVIMHCGGDYVRR